MVKWYCMLKPAYHCQGHLLTTCNTEPPAETYLIWKVGLVALSGVQKYFYTILGSQDISKMIWGIRFQEFEVMNNLISWNMIPPGFIHNFSSYDHFRRGDTSFLWYVSDQIQTHFCTTWGSRNINKIIWDIRFQDRR